MIWKINHFSNSDTVKEQFVAWEEMLDVKAPAYKLFNIWAPLDNLKYETALKDETVFTWAIWDWVWAWWNDADTTSLPISSALAWVITNYAVLKVENEIVVVKSVDRWANTIEVFKRWAWATTAAAHSDTVEADVLWFNMPRWVKDIEANFKEQTVDYNVCWKYTVPALWFTKEQMTENRKYYWENWAQDYVSEQILEKDKDLIRTVNKLIINWTREEWAEWEPWMTRWILEEASLKWNVINSYWEITALSDLETALTASRNKWWEANVLLCGSQVYDAFQWLWVVENEKPQILNRLNVELWTRVVSIHTKVWTLFLVMDLDMPNDKFVVLNSKDLSIHAFAGFTTPGGDRKTAQESSRNDQAFLYDSICQIGSLYKNSNKNMTICTWVTFS